MSVNVRRKRNAVIFALGLCLMIAPRSVQSAASSCAMNTANFSEAATPQRVQSNPVYRRGRRGNRVGRVIKTPFKAVGGLFGTRRVVRRRYDTRRGYVRKPVPTRAKRRRY